MSNAVPLSALTEEEISRYFARFTVNAMMACLLLTVFALVQMARFGIAQSYLIILLGAPLSILAFFGYSRRFLNEAGTVKRSWKASFMGLSAFIPYLLGCYLTFFKGFWHLRQLAQGFSLSVLLVSAAYVVIGYVLVSAIYRLTEFSRAMNNGQITLKPSDVKGPG